MKFCEYDDAEELAEMAKEIWTDYYSTFPDRDLPEYVLKKFQSELAIKEQMCEGYLYCFIKKDDVNVGYICVLRDSDTVLLSRIYILKDFRGQGLASEAIDILAEWCRNMKMRKLYLRVYKENTISISIYTHKGFTIVEERKEDIGDGFFLDDYIMEYRF
ncbi:MAG: GNAT family N-acetyltransferase [Methanomassiliicoccaceae archaeon]|nr:GNAT family N-acetyltransferase [Methanomassiliicoccaceae archaeon]